MNDTTEDRNDPALNKIHEDGQQEKYLVLSEEERAKGFVRPVRRSYKHLRCGGITHMGKALAETYARDPSFYDGTFCTVCKGHFNLLENGERQFIWAGVGVGIADVTVEIGVGE